MMTLTERGKRSRAGAAAVIRTLDVVVAAILLIPAVLVMVLIGGFVRISTGGPARYHQQRVGRHGRVFTLTKLRTMAMGAEADGEPALAVVDDPRLIRGGRLIRRLHLDEVPQLWSVLRGDMSLVGPRPERPEFVARYERRIPGYERRHRVRPGLTGRAQLELGYHASPEEKLALDLDYVDHRTVGRYLRTLLGTPWGILREPQAPEDPAMTPEPASGRPVDPVRAVS